MSAINAVVYLSKNAKPKVEGKRFLLFVKSSIDHLYEKKCNDEQDAYEAVCEARTRLKNDLEKYYPDMFEVELVDENNSDFTPFSEEAVFLIDFKQTQH